MTPADAAHLAPFEQALAHARARADWLLDQWRRLGGLQRALAFDRASEEQQIAAGRLAAAQRYRGLPPE